MDANAALHAVIAFPIKNKLQVTLKWIISNQETYTYRATVINVNRQIIQT